MSHSHSSYRGEPGAFQPQGHVEQPCPKASERNGALRHIYVSANGWWNCGLCQYAPAPAAPAPRAEEPEPKVLRFQDDDRQGFTLQVLRSHGDGDFHVSLVRDTDRWASASVRVCSFQGGGKHGDLYAALASLFKQAPAAPAWVCPSCELPRQRCAKCSVCVVCCANDRCPAPAVPCPACNQFHGIGSADCSGATPPPSDPLGFSAERMKQGEADAVAGRVVPLAEAMQQVRDRIAPAAPSCPDLMMWGNGAVQCELPSGHEGSHVSGSFSWSVNWAKPSVTTASNAPAAPAPTAEELTRNRVLLNKLLMARREASNIASGQNKWRMRIPAQPDDSDLLICGAFDEAIAEIDRLTASLARANEEREYSRKHGPHSDPADCPAWFDWCLCGTDNIAEIIARLRAEVAAAREALRYPAEWCRRALEDEPFVPHDSDRPGGNIVIHAKTGRDVAQTVVDAMNRLSPSPTPTEEQR